MTPDELRKRFPLVDPMKPLKALEALQMRQRASDLAAFAKLLREIHIQSCLAPIILAQRIDALADALAAASK